MIPLQEKYTDKFVEILCDTKIKTIPSLQHNKPDLVIWYKTDKTCFIVDAAFGPETITRKMKIKCYYQLNSKSSIPDIRLKYYVSS